MRALDTVNGDAGSRLKGSGLVDLLRWIERTSGRNAVLALRDKVAEPWRNELDPSRTQLGLRVGTWYPAELANALYDAMVVDVAPAQRSAVARKAGVGVGEHMLSGVYRQLFSAFVSPERMIANMPTMWRQNWTDGEVTTRMLGPMDVEGRIAGWAGHSTFGCELVRACVLTMFEKLRVGNVKLLDRSCRSCKTTRKGDAHGDVCTFRIGWSGRS